MIMHGEVIGTREESIVICVEVQFRNSLEISCKSHENRSYDTWRLVGILNERDNLDDLIVDEKYFYH